MASGRFCLVDSDAARAPGIYVFAPDRSLTSGWPSPAPVILCGQQWTPQGAAVVVSLWARGGCGNACCCHVQTSGTLNTPVLQDLAAGWRRERQLAGLCVNTSSRLPPTIRPFRQRQRSWRNGTWSGHHITPCLRVWQYMLYASNLLILCPSTGTNIIIIQLISTYFLGEGYFRGLSLTFLSSWWAITWWVHGWRKCRRKCQIEIEN